MFLLGSQTEARSEIFATGQEINHNRLICLQQTKECSQKYITHN